MDNPMTDSPDYRIYLAKEFADLHKILDSHSSKLESIVIQTTKTNGNLVHAVEEIDALKKQRDKYLETRVDTNMLQSLKDEVDTIKEELDKSVEWGHHIVDTRATECPNAKLIHQVNEDLGAILKERKIKKEYEETFFKRYEHVIKTISVIIAFISLMLVSISNHNQTKNLKGEVDMINTPVKTRNGSIEFWPSGVVIDSLGKK